MYTAIFPPPQVSFKNYQQKQKPRLSAQRAHPNDDACLGTSYFHRPHL
jgi:hypothetical protein